MQDVLRPDVDQRPLKPRAGATTIAHAAFDLAFKILNRHLFEGVLPDCLITLERKKGAFGYFRSRQFGSRDGTRIIDAIALNPAHFKSRSDAQILSTLVHDMTHAWQAHFGEVPREGYHDRQWADKMTALGLIPSHDGQPGGRRTGQKMAHFIAPGGRFDLVVSALTKEGFHIDYVGLEGESATGGASDAKARLKAAFRCPCCGAKAWGKPTLRIRCDACNAAMTS
jgi:hypothetical protein